MSRIGNKPITIPEKVTVSVEGQEISVKGPLGELKKTLSNPISIKNKDGQLSFSRSSELPEIKSLHGLSRSLINSMIIGVTKGFSKELEMVGTGYRVSKNGNDLSLTVGYSHPVDFKQVPGINFEIEGNNKITVKGIDKQLVGQVAANIRAIRPPEPYKGKGIRYVDEVVRRKAGKAAKATA